MENKKEFDYKRITRITYLLYLGYIISWVICLICNKITDLLGIKSLITDLLELISYIPVLLIIFAPFAGVSLSFMGLYGCLKKRKEAKIIYYILNIISLVLSFFLLYMYIKY